MSARQKQNNHNLPAAPREISEDTIRGMLDIQRMELQSRSEEFKLRHRELDHNSAHAEKILQAQERGRDNTRKHIRAINYANLLFAGGIILVVAILVGIAMYMDKDALAADLVKISISLAAGAIGGYGFAKSRERQRNDDE